MNQSIFDSINRLRNISPMASILASSSAHIDRFESLNRIVSTISVSRMYKNPLQEMIENNAYRFQQRFLPSSASSAISKIFQYQIDRIEMFASIQKTISPILSAKIHSTQFSLNIASNVILNSFVAKDRWDLLNTFEGVNSNIAAFEEELSSQDYVTKEDLEKLWIFLLELNDKVARIGTDIKSQINFWIGILGIFLTLTIEGNNRLNKPDVITKQDIQILRKDIFTFMSNSLKRQKEFRGVRQSCKVHLKPANNSLITTSLAKNCGIIVLQTNHKWVYISFINPKDGLAETGWIMKKYLGTKMEY